MTMGFPFQNSQLQVWCPMDEYIYSQITKSEGFEMRQKQPLSGLVLYSQEHKIMADTFDTEDLLFTFIFFQMEPHPHPTSIPPPH